MPFGGESLHDIPEPVLRRQIAIIPQEAYVFTGSLRENLTYLRPDATDAELDACAAAVGLAPLAAGLAATTRCSAAPRRRCRRVSGS